MRIPLGALHKEVTSRQYYPQWVEAVVEYPTRSPGIHPREGPKTFYLDNIPSSDLVQKTAQPRHHINHDGKSWASWAFREGMRQETVHPGRFRLRPGSWHCCLSVVVRLASTALGPPDFTGLTAYRAAHPLGECGRRALQKRARNVRHEVKRPPGRYNKYRRPPQRGGGRWGAGQEGARERGRGRGRARPILGRCDHEAKR